MKFIIPLDSYAINYLMQRALNKSALFEELKKQGQVSIISIKLNGRDGARWAKVFKDSSRGGYWVELYIKK